MPELQKFEKNINENNKDIAKQHEILRRFDEVMLTKASKVKVKQLKHKLKEYQTLEQMAEFKDEQKEEFSHFTLK